MKSIETIIEELKKEIEQREIEIKKDYSIKTETKADYEKLIDQTRRESYARGIQEGIEDKHKAIEKLQKENTEIKLLIFHKDLQLDARSAIISDLMNGEKTLKQNVIDFMNEWGNDCTQNKSCYECKRRKRTLSTSGCLMANLNEFLDNNK